MTTPLHLVLAAPAEYARWACLRYPILLRGERGTGKTVLALELHRLSGRTGPFVDGSFAKMSRGLELSELLGHCRGAFTGAIADRKGLFLRGHGGTVFLDELGRAAPEAQGALLGVLDHARVMPLGGFREIPLDVRLLAATNADLEALVAQGSFLPDLLDRFGYYTIVLKPLRQRRPEILDLARRFLARESGVIGRPEVPRLTGPVEQVLLRAPWPGNLRDLVKLCEFLAGNAGSEIGTEDLPAAFRATVGISAEGGSEPPEARVRRAIAECGGNISEAAQKLRISRTHVYRLLRAADLTSEANSPKIAAAGSLRH